MSLDLVVDGIDSVVSIGTYSQVGNLYFLIDIVMYKIHSQRGYFDDVCNHHQVHVTSILVQRVIFFHQVIFFLIIDERHAFDTKDVCMTFHDQCLEIVHLGAFAHGLPNGVKEYTRDLHLQLIAAAFAFDV